MDNRDDDSQEPGFLDEQNMPRRRRAGRHHREYQYAVPRQGISPWTIIGWCLVGGAPMIIFLFMLGTCSAVAFVSEALRQSAY